MMVSFIFIAVSKLSELSLAGAKEHRAVLFETQRLLKDTKMRIFF